MSIEVDDWSSVTKLEGLEHALGALVPQNSVPPTHLLTTAVVGNLCTQEEHGREKLSKTDVVRIVGERQTTAYSS